MNTIYIKIKDAEYPFLYGRVATWLYARKKGISNVEGQKLLTLLFNASPDDTDLMHWCCFKAGCASEKKEFPYTLKQLKDLCEEDLSILIEIEKATEESLPLEEKAQGNEPTPKSQ